MLKRHEIEVLLKAGHAKIEVARLAGVSLSSVKRIAEEDPVVHVDDTAERVQRGIGRLSLVENFRKLVVEILQEKVAVHSLHPGRRPVLNRCRRRRAQHRHVLITRFGPADHRTNRWM
jgi:nucleoside-triphosphatase THEP1